MKRIIVLCLAISVLLSVFVGCEQPDIKSDESSSESCQDSENTYEEKTDDISQSTENSSIEEANTSESTLNSDSEADSSENPSEPGQSSENTDEEKTDDIPESTENSSIEEVNTSESTLNSDLNTHESEGLLESKQENENTDETEGASERTDTELQRYNYFVEQFNQNVYDQWLVSELAKSERSKEQIYSEYLSLWINELEFTVENGKGLFDYDRQFNTWEERLDKWSESLWTVMETEINLIGSDKNDRLVIFVPYCMMFRQKVMDVKYFMYGMEYHYNTPDSIKDSVPIPIDWSPASSSIAFETQSDEEMKNVLNSVFNDTTNGVLKYFNECVDCRLAEEKSNIEDRLAEEEDWGRVYSDFLMIFWVDYHSFDMGEEYYPNIWWRGTEYKYILTSGEGIFKNPDDYQQWRSDVEQLMISSLELFDCQNSRIIFDGSSMCVLQYDLTIQEVISHKLFLYYYEYQQRASESTEPITIIVNWAAK